MSKQKRILVLGGRGLVGRAIVRRLKEEEYTYIMAPSRSELDLLQQDAVKKYFSQYQPEWVFMAAAKVGGILANNTHRADFIFQNLIIQNNVFEAAFKSGVEKLQFLGSSCIYPKMCPQPIEEDYLLTGPLEVTNEPYAIAKIAGLKTAESFRRQYGVQYFSLMPTNLYGPYDNFNPQTSHVIPALISRMSQAIGDKSPEFEVWGTGQPRREFLYVDDLANACVFMMEKFDTNTPYDFFNVGVGNDISIADLACLIANLMGYKGEIKFNANFPDGTPRKLLSVERLRQTGWTAKISLEQGLRQTIEAFKEGLVRYN